MFTVNYLTEYGAHINTKRRFGYDSLHTFIKNAWIYHLCLGFPFIGEAVIVKILIENGADVIAENRFGKKRIHAAIDTGDFSNFFQMQQIIHFVWFSFRYLSIFSIILVIAFVFVWIEGTLQRWQCGYFIIWASLNDFEFFWTILLGNIDVYAFLIKYGADVNTQGKDTSPYTASYGFI